MLRAQQASAVADLVDYDLGVLVAIGSSVCCWFVVRSCRSRSASEA